MKLRLEIDLSLFLENTGLPDLDAVREYMEAGLYEGPLHFSEENIGDSPEVSHTLIDDNGTEYPVNFRRMETDPDFRARMNTIIGDEETDPILEDLLDGPSVEIEEIEGFDLL